MDFLALCFLILCFCVLALVLMWPKPKPQQRQWKRGQPLDPKLNNLLAGPDREYIYDSIQKMSPGDKINLNVTGADGKLYSVTMENVHSFTWTNPNQSR